MNEGIYRESGVVELIHVDSPHMLHDPHHNYTLLREVKQTHSLYSTLFYINILYHRNWLIS